VGQVLPFKVNNFVGEQVMVLRLIQGRNSDWVQRPFFARYDESATWLNELKPAFEETSFFFEADLEEHYRENIQSPTIQNFE